MRPACNCARIDQLAEHEHHLPLRELNGGGGGHDGLGQGGALGRGEQRVGAEADGAQRIAEVMRDDRQELVANADRGQRLLEEPAVVDGDARARRKLLEHGLLGRVRLSRKARNQHSQRSAVDLDGYPQLDAARRTRRDPHRVRLRRGQVERERGGNVGDGKLLHLLQRNPIVARDREEHARALQEALVVEQRPQLGGHGRRLLGEIVRLQAGEDQLLVRLL